MKPDSATLNPRKSPIQARAAVTLEALQTAAIQVLTRHGLAECTTTRIAQRAGMSVGSLYQYFPNRNALLASVLECHLASIAGAIETGCAAQHGMPVRTMASALVATFLAEKLRDPAQSRALYAIAGEHDGPQQARRMHTRTIAAIAAMLASASDARFEAPLITATVAFNAMAGPVRALLENLAPDGFEAALRGQLTCLVEAYLVADGC